MEIGYEWIENYPIQTLRPILRDIVIFLKRSGLSDKIQLQDAKKKIIGLIYTIMFLKE